MQEYLKHYNVRIIALSPIHVGDGSKIGKKEFIQMGERRPVIIPDLNKMFQTLHEEGKEDKYVEFILNKQSKDLGTWLKEQNISKKKIEEWKQYSMDPGDAFVRNKHGKSATPKDILCFVKDPYGKPYVPGSSLKGMLRNALLCWRLHKNPEKYNRVKEKYLEVANTENKRGNVKSKYFRDFLKKETKEVETAVFHILNRVPKKENAINSFMAGLIVSDSHPIGEEQLMLAQKIDLSLKGEERHLPILREALKPGTKIEFEITIDSRICDVTMTEILSALDYFAQISYDYFYQYFVRGSKEKGTIWLGGGTGFLSKTMLYPIFEKDAVELTDKVFRQTLGKNYSDHKHSKDVVMGVAPHVCKCTRYQGKLYEMGMGKIEILD